MRDTKNYKFFLKKRTKRLWNVQLGSEGVKNFIKFFDFFAETVFSCPLHSRRKIFSCQCKIAPFPWLVYEGLQIIYEFYSFFRHLTLKKSNWGWERKYIWKIFSLFHRNRILMCSGVVRKFEFFINIALWGVYKCRFRDLPVRTIRIFSLFFRNGILVCSGVSQREFLKYTPTNGDFRGLSMKKLLKTV